MDKIIDLYRSQNQLMTDAIDRIVVEVYAKKKETNCKSILLTGCSSTCGVTTSAINLSIALAEAGWNTVLIDCDMRKNVKYKKNSSEKIEGLAEYLKEEKDYSDIVHKTNQPLLSYIPSGVADIGPVRLLCSMRMENLTENLKSSFDFVIFDTPSIGVVPDAGILFPMVDGITLVAALEETDKHQVTDAYDKVKNFEESYMGLIVNRTAIKQYKRHIKDFDYFREQRQREKYKEDLKHIKKKGAKHE